MTEFDSFGKLISNFLRIALSCCSSIPFKMPFVGFQSKISWFVKDWRKRISFHNELSLPHTIIMRHSCTTSIYLRLYVYYRFQWSHGESESQGQKRAMFAIGRISRISVHLIHQRQVMINNTGCHFHRSIEAEFLHFGNLWIV